MIVILKQWKIKITLFRYRSRYGSVNDIFNMFTLNMLNAGGKNLNLNVLASVLSPIIYLTAVLFLKKRDKTFFL